MGRGFDYAANSDEYRRKIAYLKILGRSEEREIRREIERVAVENEKLRLRPGTFAPTKPSLRSEIVVDFASGGDEIEIDFDDVADSSR